jgi:hypothetical protein
MRHSEGIFLTRPEIHPTTGSNPRPQGATRESPPSGLRTHDITMDFVEGFPKVGGKSVVLTVVHRMSKYAHFITLGHPYSATSVTKAFFD